MYRIHNPNDASIEGRFGRPERKAGFLAADPVDQFAAPAPVESPQIKRLPVSFNSGVSG